jgi:predicted kinase
VSFIELWLDAPESLPIDRTVQHRNDASDADASVVRVQRAQDSATFVWSRLDASVSVASVLSFAMDRVRERLNDVLNAGADEAQ